MNPMLNNMDNEELAREVESASSRLECNARTGVFISHELCRLLVERLRTTTETDLDEALLEAADHARQRVWPFTFRINQVVESLENIDELSDLDAQIKMLESISSGLHSTAASSDFLEAE